MLLRKMGKVQENLKKFSSIYPLVNFTGDFNKIIKDEDIDLVAIATPLSTHYSLAKLALTSEKHVFLEKPMTENSIQASKLVKISKKVNKILMVGYTFVYSEPIKKIKDLLKQKSSEEFIITIALE